MRTFPNVKTVYISLRAKGPDEIYDRYKTEIKDSMVFDALKGKIGQNLWRKTLKRKVRLLPMDLQRPDLGLSPENLDDLY